MSDYPSMSHVQHITFEGNDCVVMSPEEYGAALADLEAKDYELSALRAELTEARRQLAAQPAVPEAVAKDALALAYGYLWHVNNMRPGYDAPSGYSRPQLTPEKAAYKARAVLREMLTNEQRGAGINRADAILSATDSEVGK